MDLFIFVQNCVYNLMRPFYYLLIYMYYYQTINHFEMNLILVILKNSVCTSNKTSSSYDSTAQFVPWPLHLSFRNNNLFTELYC
jgi:hypothetical protein